MITTYNQVSKPLIGMPCRKSAFLENVTLCVTFVDLVRYTAVGIFSSISGMYESISIKLITNTHYQVHSTL